MKQESKFIMTGQLLKDLLKKLVFHNWNWHFNEQGLGAHLSQLVHLQLIDGGDDEGDGGDQHHRQREERTESGGDCILHEYHKNLVRIPFMII